MVKILFFCGIIIFHNFFSPVFAASTRQMIEEGNSFYKNKEYDLALKTYNEALSNDPNSALINFNAGTAQYKQQHYQQAIDSFQRSMLTEDKILEAKANYNLANAKYMLALSKEDTDLVRAAELLEGALNNYKRTTGLTPRDQDAKINYVIVENKLEELKEKLKSEPPKNKDSQKQEQNKQEKSQQQDKSQQQEKSQQSESSGGGDNRQENKQGQENERENSQKTPETPNNKNEQQDSSNKGQQPESSPTQNTQGGQEKQEQKSPGQPDDLKDISKEEANMLLDGYNQEERNAAGMLRDDIKGKEEKVLRDW